MGLTYYPPRQNEANKSDIEKINDKIKSDRQQHKLNKQQPVLLQKPTTPNVNSAASLSNIMKLYSKINPKVNDGEEPTGGNLTPVAKPKSKSKVKTDTTVQKSTVVDDGGKTKEWYENLANSSYANDKEHEADMKAFREMQAKATVDNDGKSKEWYENLANSSYANDKKYEADMKAFRKMQADEIAKNGYYTDSQGVKVYAKPMTNKPQKESEYE